MVIAISNSFDHPAVCAKKVDLNNEELTNEVMQKMHNLGFDQSQVNLTSGGQIQLKQTDNLKMHTLLLQLEQLGLDVKLTKQTLIEIA